MKELRNKKGIKQITIIMVIIMLCNFIVPNYIYAVSTEGGGKTLKAISQFVCFIPDAVINYLQKMFVSTSDIKMSGENYKIQYSPAIIFAGKVPAFDINFIDPMEDKVANKTTNYIFFNDIRTGDMGNIFSRLKSNMIESSSFEMKIRWRPFKNYK